MDQGLNEVDSCPTCRKPLFAGRTENEANPRTTEVSSDELLARQLERQNSPGHPLATGLFPADIPNPIESDPSRFSSFFFNDLLNQSNSLLYYLMITLFFLQNRDLGLDPSWLQAWSGQGVDMAGPSRASRSVGLGRVHMMMRHLASVGESYAQNALDDAAWSLWPMSPSQASTFSATVPPGGGGRTGGGLHLRSVSSGTNESLANILAMARQ